MSGIKVENFSCKHTSSNNKNDIQIDSSVKLRRKYCSKKILLRSILFKIKSSTDQQKWLQQYNAFFPINELYLAWTTPCQTSDWTKLLGDECKQHKIKRADLDIDTDIEQKNTASIVIRPTILSPMQKKYLINCYILPIFLKTLN